MDFAFFFRVEFIWSLDLFFFLHPIIHDNGFHAQYIALILYFFLLYNIDNVAESAQLLGVT